MTQHQCSGGSCRQGRSKCETPSACEVPIDEVGGIVDLCWVIFAVALLAVPFFAAVYFVADNWNALAAAWRSL